MKKVYALRSGNLWCHRFRLRYRNPEYYNRNQIFTEKFNSVRLFRHPGTAKTQFKILKEILQKVDIDMANNLEIVEFNLVEECTLMT